MARAIGTLGTIPTLSVGGVVLTDLTTLITLIAPFNNGANANTTARKGFTASGYQVTSGKVMTIQAMRVHCLAAATFILKYSDNDVGVVTATALTNGVQWGGYSAGSDVSMPATSIMESAPFAAIPALKYTTIVSSGGSGTITTYGYEA